MRESEIGKLEVKLKDSQKKKVVLANAFTLFIPQLNCIPAGTRAHEVPDSIAYKDIRRVYLHGRAG